MEPLDTMTNATVLATQLDNVKGRVDGIETSITSMRHEVAQSQQSLRQEFASALNTVKTEAAQASAALMTEIKGLAQTFSAQVKPDYAVWIAFLSLLLGAAGSIGYLAMRSYDVEIQEIKAKQKATDDALVPRPQFQVLSDDLERLKTHERRDAIKAAVNSDRLQRLLGGRPTDLNSDLKDDDK